MWFSVWCRMFLSKKACLESLDQHTRLIVISLIMASAIPFLMSTVDVHSVIFAWNSSSPAQTPAWTLRDPT